MISPGRESYQDVGARLAGALKAIPIPIPAGSASGSGSSSTQPMSFAAHRQDATGHYPGFELSSPAPNSIDLPSPYREGVTPYGIASSYNDALGGRS